MGSQKPAEVHYPKAHLRPASASEQGCAQYAANGAKGHEGHKSENQRGHQHEGKSIGRFREIEEGLHVRAGIAGGGLLNFVEHLGAELGGLVSGDNDQRFERSRDDEKKYSTHSAQAGASSDKYAAFVTAAEEGDAQKSSGERSNQRGEA